MPVEVIAMKIRPSKRASRWRRACSQVCSSKSTHESYPQPCPPPIAPAHRGPIPSRKPADAAYIFLYLSCCRESVMRTRLLFGLFFAATSLLLTCGARADGSGHTLYRVINLGDPEGGPDSQGTSNHQPGWV